MTNTFTARSGLAALALLVATTGSHAQDVDRVGLHCQTPDGYHMLRTVEACPDGSGTQVETWDALSNSSWGRHLDWEPVSYMSFPYPIAICENGFVVDRRGDDQTDDWIATRTALIADPGYQAFLGEHTSHFIYARLLEMEGAPAAEVSWQYLLSSWEADQCGMTDAYETYVREYLRVASAELEAMMPEHELFTVYNLLVINMHRRIGDFAEADARLAGFQADHADLIDESWEQAFSRLDAALAARNTGQVEINPRED